MRKIGLGSIIVAIALLNGCGGGSGSTSVDVSSASPTSIPTSNTDNTAVNKDIGTGYYVDEAVEGVDFICGKQEGITDYNGMFRFEHGEDCHFKLGYLNLRDINGSSLEDNISILEDNISVAKLLQTIDKDGNATNGIQILKDTAKILKESNIDSIPQDDALLDIIRENIKAKYQDEYNGTVVTTEDAKAHIEITRQRLEAEGRRTQHSSNIGNAGITLNVNGNSETSSSPNDTNRESQNVNDNNAMEQGRGNGQSRYTDGIVQGGDTNQNTNVGNHSGQDVNLGNNRESQNINDNNAMEQGRENGQSRYTDGIVQGGDENQGTNGNNIGESPIGTSQSNNSSESENSHQNNENSSNSSSENVTAQTNNSSEGNNAHQNNENSSSSSSENVTAQTNNSSEGNNAHQNNENSSNSSSESDNSHQNNENS